MTRAVPVKVYPTAVAQAWGPRVIESTPTIRVTLWRDGNEDRITVQARKDTR